MNQPPAVSGRGARKKQILKFIDSLLCDMKDVTSALGASTNYKGQEGVEVYGRQRSVIQGRVPGGEKEHNPYENRPHAAEKLHLGVYNENVQRLIDPFRARTVGRVYSVEGVNDSILLYCCFQVFGPPA